MKLQFVDGSYLDNVDVLETINTGEEITISSKPTLVIRLRENTDINSIKAKCVRENVSTLKLTDNDFNVLQTFNYDKCIAITQNYYSNNAIYAIEMLFSYDNVTSTEI